MNRQSKKFILVVSFIALLLTVVMLCGGATSGNNVWTLNQQKAHQIAEIAREIGLEETDPIIERARVIWWFEEHIKNLDEPVNVVEVKPEVAAKIVADANYLESTESIKDVSAVKSTVAESPVPTPLVNILNDETPVEEPIPTPVKYTKGVENYTEEEVDFVACVVFNEAGGGTSERHRELVAGVLVNRVNCPWVGSSIKECICWPSQYLAAYADYNSKYMKDAMASDDWEHLKEIARKALRGEVDIPYDVIFQAEFVQGRAVYEVCETSYSTTYFCYSEYTFDNPMLEE